MSRHHQCWNKMHVAIVKTPPTTSCISRLDRERILIANKTNHHPYLLFLYFSCFPIWNVPNTENTLLWDQLTMLLGGKPGPPSDLSHQETYIWEYMCDHVPNSLTLLTHGVQTGLVAVGLPLPDPLGPKKKKGLLQAAVPRFLSAGQARTGSSKQPPPDVPPPSTRFTRLESISGEINSVLLVECAF